MGKVFRPIFEATYRWKTWLGQIKREGQDISLKSTLHITWIFAELE